MPRTPKELERIIMKDGWYQYSQRGSHCHYKHPTKPGKVTMPFHNRDAPIGTEKNIMKQVQLDYTN